MSYPDCNGHCQFVHGEWAFTKGCPRHDPRSVSAPVVTLADVTKALDNLNKASDALDNEIGEFGKPVSSELYEWWQQAQLDADALLGRIEAAR